MNEIARDLTARISQQQDEVNQQREENRQQRDEISQLRQKADQQQDEINQLHKSCKVYPDAHGPVLTDTIQDPVHACVGESVTLQCTESQTITVLRGEYGRYADGCVSGCCEPSDADCTELMEETNPTEWQNIKTSCDGQMTCDYVYTGQVVDGCALNYTADYLQVVHHCTDFVSFSAFMSSSQEPEDGDTVSFPYLYVNAGGGYNTTTSIFTCPTTGFYYIYFNVRVRLENDCLVSLRMDDSVIASVGNLIHFPGMFKFNIRILLIHSK